MKKQTWVVNSLAAVALICMFTQCADKKTATTSAASAEGTTMKIAFVDIDSLLEKYELRIELSDQMIRKQENATATINEKGKAFEAEVREFNRKLENNAFTQERYEQENARLNKKQQELQDLQNRLVNEIEMENQKNMLALIDSISSFINVYNVEKGFDLILTNNSGLSNMLYGNPTYNITEEVTEGLNARYAAKK